MSRMDPAARTFSESWHRVAPVRVALRPTLRAQRQEFRGEPWVVLQDPMNNQYFRISEDAYAFLSRLSMTQTVGDVWQAMLDADPEWALSQEEVVQLLGQLNMSNLLQFDQPEVADSIFQRYRKRRLRETRAYLMGFVALRIPLYDPDRLLQKAMPLVRAVYTRVGFMFWLLLILAGIKVAIDNSDRLFTQSQDLLAPGNLLLLYLGFLIAKVVHEFSHAAACRRFGGEVHVIGVLLVVFAPLPYVDASASWGFRHRWQRLLVGSAGMLAEFALAAVAVMVWANTAPGPLNAVAYNVMIVASISTVVFNMNPLLRFDGYYMLVDTLDIPNLYQRSRDQLKYLFERFVFGVRAARSAAWSRSEAFWLPTYGILSILYWVVLISTIVFFVADRYLGLGIIMALIMVGMFVVWPALKFLYYLVFSPRLLQRRARAMAVTLSLAGVLVVSLGVVSFPDRIRAPGVVEAVQFRQLHNDTSGFLDALLAQPGARVEAGQPLLQLHNAELDVELRRVASQRQQLQAQELRAGVASVADQASLRQQRLVLESRLRDLLARQQALVVTAPVSGVWSAPELDNRRGSWLARGSDLGRIVADDGYRFVAVLPQVATRLFDAEVALAEVRLRGEEDVNLLAGAVHIVPFEHGTLPSPALGWAGGGAIAVASDDPSGMRAAEPFFRIHATLDAEASAAHLLHGRSGTMRITLEHTPLLVQWERQVRQFLQRRFRL